MEMENQTLNDVYFHFGRSLEDSGSKSPEDSSSQTVSRSNDTVVIRETLRVYGSLYLLFSLLFCYLRRRFPKHYNLRSWVPEMECELAKASVYPGWFSWAFKVMDVDDTQLLQSIGMDGLCFIRCLRLGAKLSFGGVLNSIWLIPLFLTAEDEAAEVTVTDRFAKISVAHLASGSPRFAGVVIAAYIILFYALHLISKELDWYAEFRHKYLSQLIPRNYAIYVSGIPDELQSDFALGDYFRSWSSESAIVEAHMTMDTPSLDANVAKREMVIEKLEHAMVREHILGVKAQHRTVSFKNLFRRGIVTEKVNSVAAYKQELNKLNHKIAIAIGKITNKNDRMRQFMSRQPASSSGKAMSFPTLSPLREQEDTVLFEPENETEEFKLKNHNDEVIDTSEGHLELENDEPEMKGYLHQDNTPPHPFLQLVGMQEFYDDGGINERDSEANPPNNLSLGETEPMPESHDLELGIDLSSGKQVLTLEDQPADKQNSNDEHQAISQKSMESEHYSRSDKLSGLDFEERPREKTSGRALHIGVKKITGFSFQGVKQVKKATEFGVHHAAKAADFGLSGARKAAGIGVSTLNHAPEFATMLKESAAFIAPALAGKEDGAPRSAGFVVFRSLFTCQAARQMLQHAAANAMVVEPAPPPDGIFWPNVGLPDNAKKTGNLLSFVATASLCFFWSIPVAFISSLTAIDSLKETLPTVAKWVDEFPWLETFLATLAPLILLALNEGVLPSALKWFSTWEGLVGSPQLEASTFVKLSSFMIIQTFFVSAISGSITAELANILDNPEDLVVLLGNSLATQSSFFIQIVLVFTFMVQGFGLLRVGPIGLSILRRFVGPRLTTKERRKTWKFARSLEDPPEFVHAEVFAQMILFYVVFFVYAPIAPVTCIFLWICFLICESGFRYHFIHNHRTQPDSGGRIFKGFTRVLIGSIFIGELTLLGTLGLKKAVYAVPALLPMLIITGLYTVLVYPKKIQVAESLPTIMCVELDRQRKAEGVGVDFLVGKYLQPSLKHRYLLPEENWE